MIQTASLPLQINSFSVANLCDMLENQTLPAIVLIKKQYRVFEESESANFCQLRLLKPQKCPDSNSPALIGAQNNLGGGTKFLPEKFVTAIEFCPKKFSTNYLRNWNKNYQFWTTDANSKKVNSLRNKMVTPKNGQINMTALRVAFFKAHFYFSNFLWYIV